MTSPSFLALSGIALLLCGILFLRMPIGFLLAAIGFGGYALLDGPGRAVTMLGNEFWATFTSAGLTVIPLFVFMGQLCYHSGLSGRLYAAVSAWLGHMKGGVAVATLAACGGFAAICGSNTATAATMSVVSLPEMEKAGYNKPLACGIVATGTTLGAIIPPSVVAIVLGIQTGLSVRQLFMGGIAPGLALMLLFMVTVYVLALKRPDLAPAGARKGMRERMASLPGLFEALLLFFLVVGGLSVGVFTPTEAGAAGSAFALAIGIVRRDLGFTKIYRACIETLQISAMIFLLLAGAGSFGKFLVLSRVPFMAAEWVGSVGAAPWTLLLLIFLVYLIGGMIMDALALLLITLPVFYPLVEKLGFDPLWFCLVLLVITSLGAITPPVGASAYVVASMGREPLGRVFRGTIMFMPAFMLLIAGMLIFPKAVLFLPLLQ